MAYLQLNFQSEYLMGNTTVSVVLPDKARGLTPKEFYSQEKKYKVLWLLHGTFGDHSDWVRKSNIELYACERDLIVVMPSALNSNYANWPEFSIGFNMYDYLTEELMPLIYGWFPASEKREDNFIAGLSMGGRGTCVYAFNHPEKFAAAAVLSACPRNVDLLPKQEPNMWKRTQGSIKNAGGLEKYLDSYENTWKILGDIAQNNRLHRIYFAIGKQDMFYDAFLSFQEYAKELKLDAEFEIIDGYSHEWRFWDLTIQHALSFFGLDDTGAGNPY